MKNPVRPFAPWAALALAAFAAVAAGSSPQAEHDARVAHGRYLALVMGCGDCHTPGSFYGAPDTSRWLAGSEMGWRGPWGVSYARNLTPDFDTGLGYYKPAEIAAALLAGRRLDGKPMLPPMPSADVSRLTQDDALALATYLLSLKPVAHQVPDAVPPGKEVKGPVVEFPPPPAWDAPRPAPGH